MEDKNCTICEILKLNEDNGPNFTKAYYCPFIRELIYSTRKLNMKLDKLKNFHCNNFKRKQG